MKTTNLNKRTGRTLAVILCLYAFLTATHQGEFWPFSIYPMFSKAGKPWVKVVTRQIFIPPKSIGRKTYPSRTILAGKPLALRKVGINRNDLANYITQTRHWNDESIRGLRGLLNGAARNGPLLIYKVKGSSNSTNDSVMVEYIPFLYLTSDTVRFASFTSMILTKTIKCPCRSSRPYSSITKPGTNERSDGFVSWNWCYNPGYDLCMGMGMVCYASGNGGPATGTCSLY